MAPTYALFLGPVVVAPVLAVLIWLRRGTDGSAVPAASVRAWTIIAVAVPLSVVVGRQMLSVPLWMLQLPHPVQGVVVRPWFVWPVVLGLVAMALLLLPLPVRRANGAAEVSRRTIWTFASTRILIWLGVLLAVTVALTLAAGIASALDEQGHYRMFFVENGDITIGTAIYGWYYSVPALILLGVTCLFVLFALALIARPPLALEQNRERDLRLRRLRTRNVLLAALGGVSTHLGAVLTSLSITSTARGSVPAGAGGLTNVGTPFAALTTALAIAGACLLTVGLTAWLTVLLSMIPVPRRTSATAGQP